MSYRNKVQQAGPFKLLALDGGGIRGAISIEVLAKIERLLRDRLDRVDLVLADYFDYIAGTSTGGVIATCLSLGMSVDQVRDFYEENGKLMFEKAWIFKRLKYKYDDDPLAEKLREVLRDEQTGKLLTFGSDRLKTLLLLVMRNATTDSPWPLSNNPQAKYNDSARPDCNANLPLWQLVRASTAAPVYFPPEVIELGRRTFIFVDGGITMYNNPAFQLFLMATAGPYRLRWRAGEDNMLMVSIGTGTSPNENGQLASEDMNLLYNAQTLPSALMYAALNEQDFLCRVFGRCLAGPPLDREIGDMVMGSPHARGVEGPTDPKLFAYVRYNAALTREGLDELGLSDIEPQHVQKLDSVEHIDALQRVGKAVAERQVKAEHFASFS